MANTAITVDKTEVDRLMRAISSEGKRNRAFTRAASNAIRATKSESVKQATGAAATRAKGPIRNAISSARVGKNGKVEIKAKSVPAHKFRNWLDGTKPKAGRKSIATQWYRDSSRKRRDGWFRITPRLRQNSPIVMRVDEGRYPLYVLQGPTAFTTVSQGVKGERRGSGIAEFAGDKYQTELDRQIDLIFRGA